MAIIIKLLAAGIDLGAAVEFEALAMLGGAALAAGVGHRVLRPRARLA